jgi:hypothetical protein
MRSSGGYRLIRGDASGAGIYEYSSRADFITIPVPFIGALNSNEIPRINYSSEMSSFSCPGNYNPLIPRRIVEEARAKRALCGQKKVASEFLLSLPLAQTVREQSSQRLIEEYRSAISANDNPRHQEGST